MALYSRVSQKSPESVVEVGHFGNANWRTWGNFSETVYETDVKR
jgi:hypothetical protein